MPSILEGTATLSCRGRLWLATSRLARQRWQHRCQLLRPAFSARTSVCGGRHFSSNSRRKASVYARFNQSSIGQAREPQLDRFYPSAEGSASRAACANRATRDRPRLDDGETSPGLFMLRKARTFCDDWYYETHSRGRLAKRLLLSKTTVLKFLPCNCVPEVP